MHLLGKWLHWLLSPLIYACSSRDRPRVRVEILNANGQVMLVKSWLSRQQWSLPGGGVGRGEAPSRAAVREVREETGLFIDHKRLSYLVTVPADYPLKCDLVVYTVTISQSALGTLPWYRRFEIIHHAWHEIDDLPDDISGFSRAIIRREFAEE